MDLSVIIPARNEIFLKRTIEDILEHIEGDTEVIAVLDGYWSNPSIEDNPRVTLIHFEESVGQRAAVNAAARISRAKYIMKVDGHCSFDQGFDVKMMKEMQDDWTMVPIMRNLWAFDWKCPEGHTRYQGPSGPCKECGQPTTMDIKWIGKGNPQSTSYCFDSEPHFQYFGAFKKRSGGKGDLTETMSLQGSCFMVTREKYFELDLCSEEFGSWGSQGIEVAAKTWLSGGKVICNHKTWYAHMFRTQGGDFGFPYPQSGRQVARAKKMAGDVFFNNKWEKQIHPLSWLLERFWPVPGWTDEALAKLKTVPLITKSVTKPALTTGLVYYTDNQCDPNILSRCQENLKVCCNGNPLVSVSLKPIDFGENIVVNEKRSALTMFKQILAGLEKIKADIVFLVEHDVLYPPSHFDFVPLRKDLFYYNQNVWKSDWKSGRSLFYYAMQTLALCAYRDLLIEHYKKRVALVKEVGFSTRIGYEPGTHNRAERVDDYKYDVFWTSEPLVDIRHGSNLSPSRWRQDQFRNKKNLRGWTEDDKVPHWGVVKE